ncbi:MULTISPECIES: GntR family transcriptional regulator [unclassified Erwinia]|uniref:GntR family transcriptional regulator n=1 Tax=unclassified Erwinia TaxID=2622719 RepID=UPI0006F33C9A|nr:MULTISPECIES: GntR family transcriptional regulator [unclassified Erwinia]KQN54972.1 GntR family transcriptional regulator [Erwinia sp. Leaf53]PLV63294.1 GntR family transcriptional regulator [Erwinia sp. B116]
MSTRVISARQQEVQRIIDALSRAIAEQRIAPGTRLVEAQIVDALAANRNHVQAALQRLALQHVVTISPNRGARVAKPGAREAREVFSARHALERALLAEITVEKMQRHQAAIDRHMQAEQQAIASGDRREVVRLLSAFHLLLARIADNRVLDEMLTSLMVRSALIVSLYQRNASPCCQSDEHAAIISALRAGEQEQAQVLLHSHLALLEDLLRVTDSDAVPDNLREALSFEP